MNNSTSVGNVTRSANYSRVIHFAKAVTALLFFVFAIQFNAKAQAPSCNLSGPLQATVRGAAITVNVQVANSTAKPNLDYTLVDNKSGAVIVAKGPIVYNSVSNSLTQTVTVDPGTATGGFNLQLVVTTSNGKSQCSKSVSVAN